MAIIGGIDKKLLKALFYKVAQHVVLIKVFRQTRDES